MDTMAIVPADDLRVCGWCPFKKMCWGQKWQEYIANPALAVDAAARLLPDQLLPPGAPR
jgi:hypothetical protein